MDHDVDLSRVIGKNIDGAPANLQQERALSHESKRWPLSVKPQNAFLQ